MARRSSACPDTPSRIVRELWRSYQHSRAARYTLTYSEGTPEADLTTGK